jgi:DNA polymerase-3 subunit beta
MRFTIARTELLNALNIVSKAISQKEAIQIYHYIKFSFIDDGLSLFGTDGKISIKYDIPTHQGDKQIITVFQKGNVLLDGKLIVDVVRKLDNDQVEFYQLDNIIKVFDSNATFDLNSLDDSDFPNLDFEEKGSDFELDGIIFENIISKTGFAAATNEIRHILTGVNLIGKEGNLEATATDGLRIARVINPLDNIGTFNVTVPTKLITDISKIIENEKGVKIIVTPKRLIFKLPFVKISLILLSGNYPDTSRFNSLTNTSTLKVSLPTLMTAIDRLSIFNNERPSVKLILNDSQFILNAKSQLQGNGNEVIHKFEYKGDLLNIAINSKYLLDALKTVSSEEVEIRFNGEQGIISVIDLKDSKTTQLIQPYRYF